ncbi:MAG TPA: Ldh family oxidoreductase [Candidatus Bathyarchaeota archaeon]|nr:Ldh family oxidoreductase [Candidatus Bathyarchaeota archaeon]
MVKYIIVPDRELQEFSAKIFMKMGVSKAWAENIAEHLVLANLRGVDSHGVIRIPYYVEGIRKGWVKPQAKIKTLRETMVTSLIDGGGGLGIVVATKATEMAIEKAKKSGVALVGARNLGHVGMLAYYTIKIVDENLIGFACANAPAAVAPWGGRERVFGTNPISLGFPLREGKPIVIDMATSSLASFKVLVMKLQNKKLPPESALDREGRFTTDPEEALRGTLLPFGKYKGYSFSLMVEVLSSALVGGPTSKEVIPHASTQGGFLVAALDPAVFRSYDEYEADMKKIIEAVTSCPPMEGVERVLLPGEIEDKTFHERKKMGIPIDGETWGKLKELAEELRVDLPRTKMEEQGK